MHYALMQDSGTMVKALKKNGSISINTNNIKRMDTSLVTTVKWCENEIDFEEHAKKYIEIKFKQIKEIPKEDKFSPDPIALENIPGSISVKKNLNLIFN